MPLVTVCNSHAASVGRRVAGKWSRHLPRRERAVARTPVPTQGLHNYRQCTYIREIGHVV